MQRVEPTYSLYLRFVWMFIDLSTETVLSLMRHLIKSDDVSAFLKSREQQVKQLKKKKVINKTEYKKVTKETENPDQFDLNLLITLIINLVPANELPPPKKGWDKPTRSSDKSLAADLLRLRHIRNFMVAHSPKAKLEEEEFNQKWTQVKKVLIRVQRKIISQEYKGRGPEFEQEIERNVQAFTEKMTDYRNKPIEPCPKRMEDLIKAWKVLILEVQTEVDRLLNIIADFDRYFKSHSKHRYDQYVCLLDKGGKFVLSSYLKLKIDESCSDFKDFKELLRQKESTLRKEIKDSEQLLIIQNMSSSTDTVIQSLNISSLAVVILHMFRNDDEEIRREIKCIKSAHETYAEIAVKALDNDDEFDDASSDLKASLKFISKFLRDEKDRIYTIIEECKKTNGESKCADYLKSHGIKSLTDVYEDIKEKTKSVLQKMTTEDIPFGSVRVLEVKMITCGTSEEQTRLAEKILVEVWREALERSDDKKSFSTIENEVHKILIEIRKKKDITSINIEQKCILLSIASTSPLTFLDLLEYFESDPFRQTVSIISQELGYHFGTVFRIHSCLTIESLHEILDYRKDVHEEKANNLRLLIGVSSPESMLKLQSLSYSEQVSNSKKAISESLSTRLNETIHFDLCMDGIDIEFAQERRTPSSEESSDNDQPLKEDIFMTDNLTETIPEDENKLFVTEAKMVVEENKITDRTKLLKDASLIESEIKEDVLKKGQQEMIESRGSNECISILNRRPRRDCADTGDYGHDKEYRTLMLLGVLLDMSCMKEKQQNSKSKEFILSQIKVIADAVQFNVSKKNRIFAAAVGGSQGSGIFDIIGTLQSEGFRRFGPITDKTMESMFKCFEENGAGITRKWVDRKIVQKTVLEHEAKLILNSIKSNPDFTRRFFDDFLHVSCRDLGFIGFFIQKMYASIVSFYRQATAQEIREVVNRSMTNIEESLLIEIKSSSVYNVHDAALSLNGSNGMENTHARHQQILASLDPFIYGEKKVHSSMNDVCSLFQMSLSVHPNHQRILFVISDGCSSEKVNIGGIKRQLEEANVTVVCFFTSFSMADDQKTHDGTDDSFDDGKKLLFELSSTFPQDPLSRAIFLKCEIDVQEENGKMFFIIKDFKRLSELCNSVRNALSCRDSLFDIVPFVSLDKYINIAGSAITNRDLREQSFAIAVATIICLSMQRNGGGVEGYPDIHDLLDEVSKLLEEGKQNAQVVLQNVLATYHLHCRSVDINGAMRAVAAKRLVISKFHLTDEELTIFRNFYEENPFGILKPDDISLHEKLPDAILTEHSVLLVGFNCQCLRFMNFWGDTWADMGFFRVENAGGLEIEFIDVYWNDEEISVDKYMRQNEVIKNFERELTKLKTKLITCPSCKKSIKIITLGGTLPLAECPLCKQIFPITEKDKASFALKTYLSSLSR